MKACACRWSVIGILLSLNGGVINPMRNWEFEFCMGGSAIEGVRVANKRVAKFWTLERRGTSDEAWRRERERSSNQEINITRNIRGCILKAHAGYGFWFNCVKYDTGEKKVLLECNNDMAFRRDRIRLLSVCRQVVVPPENFRLCGTHRKSWRSGWIRDSMWSCSNDATHWTARLWCKWSHCNKMLI